jgi:hypothetical protein
VQILLLLKERLIAKRDKDQAVSAAKATASATKTSASATKTSMAKADPPTISTSSSISESSNRLDAMFDQVDNTPMGDDDVVMASAGDSGA